MVWGIDLVSYQGKRKMSRVVYREGGETDMVVGIDHAVFLRGLCPDIVQYGKGKMVGIVKRLASGRGEGADTKDLRSRTVELGNRIAQRAKLLRHCRREIGEKGQHQRPSGIVFEVMGASALIWQGKIIATMSCR